MRSSDAFVLALRIAAFALTCLILSAEEQTSAAAEPAREERSSEGVVSYAFTSDSDGNLRHITRFTSDVKANGRAQVKFFVGETRLHNSRELGQIYHAERFRSVGARAAWKTGSTFSVDGEASLVGLPDTTWPDGDSINGQHTVTGTAFARFKPSSESMFVDLGFHRTVHDLTPELVMNRVLRNEAQVRTGVVLPSGWRWRGRGDIGVMTGTGEWNRYYNVETTLAHNLGKNSEWNVAYGDMHYNKESWMGYYSADRVQTLEGGWSTELQRSALGVAADTGIGLGRSKEHHDVYGPLGLSLRGQVDLKWRFSHDRELWLTGEYYYNQFNPALQLSPAAGWSMTCLSVSFHWRYPRAVGRAFHPRNLIGRTSSLRSFRTSRQGRL
jgi:hypothetical protein